MGLETGFWIEDLDVNNPFTTDDKRQGDDHLRLIKTVLKNTLKRTSGRPVYFPTSMALVGNYTILDSDENTIFRCSTTGGAFTLILPNTLTSANSGWRIFVVKTNVEPNPVFIVPPSGLLDGFSKVRRTAENKITEIMWTGTGWVITRPNNAPVGTVHEYYGTTLPNGFLWPDGGAFNSADFVELAAILGTGTKPDCRGRTSVGRDDMGGSAQLRVTIAGSGINGTALYAAGGTEVHVLLASQLAQHSHSITDVSHQHGTSVLGTTDPGNHQHNAFINDPGHRHVLDNAAQFGNAANGGSGGNASNGVVLINTGTAGTPNSITGIRVKDTSGGAANDRVAAAGAHTHTITGSVDAQFTGITTTNAFPTIVAGAHQNMPPSIICNKIMVAE